MSSQTPTDDATTNSTDTDQERDERRDDDPDSPTERRDPEAHSPTERRDQDACPGCGGRTQTDGERGETVCTECGLVVDETVLDGRPERTSDDGDRRRTGPPTTARYHDDGLGTVIADDAAGNAPPSSPRKRRQLRRMRTWNKRSLTRTPGERSLQFALGELDRMASSLSVPEDVRETASVILRRAHDAEVHRGRSMEATATASLYAALRRADVPVTLDGVTDRSRVDHDECQRVYNDLVRELSLEIAPPDPATYLPGIASELGVDDEIAQIARRMLERAKARGEHVGKHPAGQAAAALYAAGLVRNADLTQAAIGEAADVSSLTIREHYGAMLEAWRDGDA